ncbi:hypothetical protein [Streptomyces sp. NPDC006551]|uniref:hypothetical protein n=1 Tax=Streptomyces sp. NPDC006551 TaxID=3157178 RepID=UPI00339E15C3
MSQAVRICCHPIQSVDHDPTTLRLYCRACTGALSAPLRHPMTYRQFPKWLGDVLASLPDDESGAQVDRIFGAMNANLSRAASGTLR